MGTKRSFRRHKKIKKQINSSSYAEPTDQLSNSNHDLVKINVLLDCHPSLFSLCFDSHATVQTLKNYLKDQYLFKGHFISLEENKIYNNNTLLSNINQFTLKFISSSIIKKKKELNIYYNNPIAIKLEIPIEYTTLHVLNDLFTCTCDLFSHYSPNKIDERLLLHSHPQKDFYYIPHGQTFQLSSRLGTLLNIPPPRVLKGSFTKGYNFAFFNCNGLSSATDGIIHYLKHGDTDVLIAFETMTNPGKKAISPCISLVNINKHATDAHNTSNWYGTGVFLNPRFYNKEKVNIVNQTDIFVKFQFKQFTILAIYLPPTKLEEYFHTIVMGDLNIDYESPRTPEAHDLCAKIRNLGLTIIPLNDTHTYCHDKATRQLYAHNREVSIF